MPSRKQRRRREKLQRHEYEYVIETEEGEEVVVERPEDRADKDGKKPASGPRDRRGREIPKPSLQRVLRRTAIFGPLILVVVFLTSGKDATTAAKIYTAFVLLAFFIPFSYMVDVFMYRVFQRRQRGASGRR
jgi:hypothetical protein